jgi:CBS-domain-containing membrane protein
MSISEAAMPGRCEVAASARAGTLLGSGLVERGVRTLETGVSLGAALDCLAGERLWGVPVLDRGAYVGTVTAASLIAFSLPVTPDSLAPNAGLAWLQADLGRLRRRLGVAGRLPVERALDIGVPTIRASSSAAHLLLMLARRAPLVAVLDDEGARLIGMASAQTAMRLLRPAA